MHLSRWLSQRCGEKTRRRKVIVKLFNWVILAFVVTENVVAALPPYYERVREIKLVLDSEALKKRIGNEILASGLIDSITDRSRGDGWVSYVVGSGSCTVEVKLRAETPNGLVGPLKYSLYIAKEMDCEKK